MESIIPLILDYGSLIIFANVLFEQAGIPVPTLPTLMLAGALASSGGTSIWVIFLVVFMAAGSADGFWYFAGIRYGHKVLGVACRASFSKDSCVSATHNVFAKVGPRSLLVSKFVPGIGPVAVAISGAAGVSLPRFLLLDAIGAILYLVPPVLVGHMFRDAVEPILNWASHIGFYGFFGVLAAVAVVLVKRRLRRRNGSKLIH